MICNVATSHPSQDDYEVSAKDKLDRIVDEMLSVSSNY